ncbi:imidazole glycerol phosphate synthase subunit HisH [Polynucleobacter sp.]|uniref:imidazole glycerol phosphate synthase subunit HisH n=1 Tax=Polynucleobacter sp. TaxID=2029855 RepID=UPI003F69F8AB
MSDFSSKNYSLVIVDYGAGNLLNIQRAFEYLGVRAQISSDPNIIAMGEKIVLPGVGAFPAAMKHIHDLNIDSAIIEAVHKGAYLMGICLGMQMLLSNSHEMGFTSGLNLIEGSVIPIEGYEKSKFEIKIPHIGWEKLRIKEGIKNPLLNGVMEGESAYFLHSYKAVPLNTDAISANALYSGIEIPSLLWSNNIFGCQFHPEKSGPVGLKVIKNFISL